MTSRAMPSPRRTVASSVAMLRNLGYGKQAALRLIVIVCDQVLARPDMQPGTDCRWAGDVRAEAITRLGHANRNHSPGDRARAATGRAGA